MAGGNPFHDALLDDLVSQFAAGPLADGATVLAGGLRTPDLAGPNDVSVSTSDFADAVAEAVALGGVRVGAASAEASP